MLRSNKHQNNVIFGRVSALATAWLLLRIGYGGVKNLYKKVMWSGSGLAVYEVFQALGGWILIQ